jgi:ABC-2 type transport system permease protein
VSERRRLRSLLVLTYLNGLLPIRRQPLFLINLIASPLTFLFFISLASNSRLLQYGVAGGMLLTVLSIGTSLQTDISHYKQDLKFQDMLVASPIEAPVYVGGMALSELVYSLPGLAVFGALWILVGSASIVGAFEIFVVLVLAWAFASALGFTLATYFQDIRETFAFSPLISLALTVLPPVYYPLSYLPSWIQPLAYLVPTTYAADLLHAAFHLPGAAVAPAWVDWLVVIAFTVVLFVLAAFKARWRDP